MIDVGNAVELHDGRGGYLLNGSSKDFSINGSVTPMYFTLPLLETLGQFAISRIDMAFNCTGPMTLGANFLDLTAPLTNGLEFGILNKNDVYVPMSRGAIKNNIDLFSHDPHGVIYTTSGNDIICSFSVAGPMQVVVPALYIKAIYVKVQDNLSTILQATAYCRVNRV
jgi:hypothetical protein